MLIQRAGFKRYIAAYLFCQACQILTGLLHDCIAADVIIHQQHAKQE